MDDRRRPAGWYPDPARRFELRWHNGEQWTADVAVHGQRHVDPVPATGTTRDDERNGRAVTALVLGLVAIAVVWVPVFFVAGAVAAAIGVTMAIVALRHRTGLGRPMALWGLGLSLASFAGLPVGWMFTQSLLERIEGGTEAGSYEVSVVRCDTGRFSITLEGSITNRDDAAHDYAITVHYLVDGEVVAVDTARTDPVEPGDTVDFVTIGEHRVAAGRTAQCSVVEVTDGGLFLP